MHWVGHGYFRSGRSKHTERDVTLQFQPSLSPVVWELDTPLGVKDHKAHWKVQNLSSHYRLQLETCSEPWPLQAGRGHWIGSITFQWLSLGTADVGKCIRADTVNNQSPSEKDWFLPNSPEAQVLLHPGCQPGMKYSRDVLTWIFCCAFFELPHWNIPFWTADLLMFELGYLSLSLCSEAVNLFYFLLLG